VKKNYQGEKREKTKKKRQAKRVIFVAVGFPPYQFILEKRRHEGRTQIAVKKTLKKEIRISSLKEMGERTTSRNTKSCPQRRKRTDLVIWGLRGSGGGRESCAKGNARSPKKGKRQEGGIKREKVLKD